MEARLFGEIDALIFGDEDTRAAALPPRHWVETGEGWASHDPERCIPEYECGYLVYFPKVKPRGR